MTQPQIQSLDDVALALAEKHAEDQDAVANNLVASLALLWNTVDFYRLDETTIQFVEQAAPEVERAYLQSQRLTANFYTNTRFAQLPTAEPLPVTVPDVELPFGVVAARFTPPTTSPSSETPLDLTPPDLADIKRGLLAESNFAVKAATPGGSPDVIMHNAEVNTAGASVTRAMNGGRNASSHAVLRDRRVLGYARFTDGDPCYFCAMLAARGAVYKKDSFLRGGRVNYNRASEGLTKADKDFEPHPDPIEVPDKYIRIAKVHSHCRCTLRPVYSKSSAMDDEAKFYKAQWDSIYKPGAGEDNVNAFRLQYKPFQRQGADVVELSAQLQERETALLNAGFSPASPQVQWATTASNLLAV